MVRHAFERAAEVRAVGGEHLLVAYAEDLPIIRRHWRLILGKQHAAEAACEEHFDRDTLRQAARAW